MAILHSEKVKIKLPDAKYKVIVNKFVGIRLIAKANTFEASGAIIKTVPARLEAETQRLNNDLTILRARVDGNEQKFRLIIA